MIVVWMNKRDWKTPGPIVNMAVHNAASFADLGYETHLCIGHGPGTNTSDDLTHFYGLPPQDRLNIHRIDRWRLGSSSYSFSVFSDALRLIRSLCRRDHVAVFTRESGFLAPLAWCCRHPRIHGFYELHDLYADLSWMDRKKIGQHREKLYEHLFLPRLSGLICITHAQRELYRKVFPRIPSCAFPLGTKPMNSDVTPEAKRKRRTLMYVGRMHTDKGVDLLLGAAGRLAKADVRFLFWGGKASRIPKLEEKAKACGAAGSVRFVPFQPPEAMHQAMAEKASLGGVMLEDTFYNRYLTCPVKALDYLSHGIPAVGSDLPSVREVLGKAGTYLSPGDEEGLVRAVLRLLDGPDQYRKMCELTQRRAAEITWQKRARALAAFTKEQMSASACRMRQGVEFSSARPRSKKF
jgi:glycosyltransferase involved in cell wall biosynthesis